LVFGIKDCWWFRSCLFCR